MNTTKTMTNNYTTKLRRHKANLLISVAVTVFLFMNCYVRVKNVIGLESRLQIVTGKVD